MGNSASGEEDYYEEDDYAKQFDGIETLGYRVLGVQPNSPASKAGLVSFFDFIVGANQLMLLGSGVGLKEGDEYDDVDFPSLLRENLHKPVELLVWNIKAREKRVVTLLPSDDWGGAGLLGVTIKLDDYGGADERLVRVLETVEKGPAHQAGLIAGEDYLLGTTMATLSNTDVLESLLHGNLGRVVELYVYNSVTDVVRVVGLHPTYRWGDGSSLLGASVGTGYLHRLPEACRTTIGSSVERKVSVSLRPCNNGTCDRGSGDGNGNGLVENGRDNYGETTVGEHRINIEPTLEMEVDHSDDEDDGDEQNRNTNRNRPRAVQPHQLGTTEVPTSNGEVRAATATAKASATPAVGGGTDPEDESDLAQTPKAAGTVERPDPPPSSERAPVIVPAADDDDEQQPSVAAPDGFPQAASVGDEEEKEAAPLPSPSPNLPPPPPPPLAESPSRPPPPPPAPPLAATSPHPPPPPPPPPPAQPTASPDPPDDDDDGSEYTDGSYTDDDEEYTDDEHESPQAKRGGFFSSFMPAPPKMEY